MEIINWLNVNDGVIIAIATVVLVIVTIRYTWLTGRLLKANDKPEVAVSLRPHEAHVNLVMLCIENIGTGAARNLQFVTNPSTIQGLDRPLENIGFLRGGIPYFEPGRKIEQFLVNVIDKFDQLKQTPLEIIVTYKDSGNRKYESVFPLDFGENEGFSQIDRPPLFEIAKVTKEIQKDLRHITTGFRKPIILTESLTEHRLGQSTRSLEIRISQLPIEIRQEILQEVDVVISRREQEIREKEQREQTAKDADLS